MKTNKKIYATFAFDKINSKDIQFHSVNSHVKEMACQIFGKKECTQEEVDGVRKSGYKTNKSFWINLTIASVESEDNDIFISDLWAEDLHEMPSEIITVIGNKGVLPKEIKERFKIVELDENNDIIKALQS